MSGGDDVFMLASSHAFTSRMTLESGLAGRSGGRTGGRGETRSNSIDTNGMFGISLELGTAPVEGAVRGRLRDAFRCTPASSAPPFKVWRDATFRKCRCSHFFAAPCLLFAAETVYSVVVAVMLVV